MNRLVLALVLALPVPLARAALAELNPADGTIEVADGSFTGRDFQIARDFKLELLYNPPAATEGQWVAMAWDNKGRLLIPSYNSERLNRVTIPKVGSNEAVRVERLYSDFGGAEGVLYAFNSLYVNLNRANSRRAGIYRLTDTNGDDKYDQIRVIRNIQGDGGDHGTHNLRLSPDGKSIFLINGNATKALDFQTSKVPGTLLGEDNLVLRIPTNFMDYYYAPQGFVADFDPEGKSFDLFAAGMRNPVDFAFNKDGELFDYDADMELDWGLPWYRPTNVQHVTSGADFGFRNGARKHPTYYFDYSGLVTMVGAGSPTGTSFGTGAKFPARYQDAYFISDWSYGNLWSVMIQPEGSSYTGEVLPFISGRPFAVSGVIVNPADGSLIVQTTGTQLYRVTYAGTEATEPTKPDTRFAAMREQRRSLEKFHGKDDPAAVSAVWPFLGDSDRALRYAARTALEWQDQARWRDRALAETDPRRAIGVVASLARLNGKDEYFTAPDSPAPDRALQQQLLATLGRIDWGMLPYQDKLDLLRAYTLVFTRLGKPDEATRQRLVAKFDPYLPAVNRELNWELAEMLVYLEAPSAATKVMALLRTAPTLPFYPLAEWANPQQRVRNNPGMTGPQGKTNASLAKQEDQIQYAQLLRVLKTGWTPALREEYFRWFPTAAAEYRGGSAFFPSLQSIRTDAVALLPDDAKASLANVLAIPVTAAPAAAAGGRGGP
jgi:glucose/arabinose dehydrogenase